MGPAPAAFPARLAAACVLLVAAGGLRPPAAGAAAAHDGPPLQSAFTGTIVSTYPDGRTARLWLSEDGGYEAAGRRGDRSKGRWSLKGDAICLRQSRPIPSPFAFCTPKPTSIAWTAKAFTGEAISVRLVSGGRPS